MLQIYGVPVSVHTRKVIVAAIEKELPYQIREVVPIAPGTLPVDWKTLSPTGRIPVLQDEDLVLADSTAICAYLNMQYPGQALYPKGIVDHAKAVWLEQYAGGTLFREIVHPLFHEVFVQPNINQIPTNPGKVDSLLSNAVPEIFSYLNDQAKGRFLVGSRLTMADVSVASNLINYRYLGFELGDQQYPDLVSWFHRVLDHPAMQKALTLEQPAVQAMGLNGESLRRQLGLSGS